MTYSSKVLVVEDDASVVRLLEIIFKQINLEVYSTFSGKDVEALVEEINPLLFILDIGLPDSNGVELISMIRQRTEAPIIMLSGKDTDLEKISSFSYGADDYVVKPFSVGEFLARSQAVLRRTQTAASTSSFADDTPSVKEKGSSLIDINMEQHRVFINSTEISLTNKEFQLLHLLHNGKGNVLSREIILDNVWGIDNFDIETRAVDACVSRLRKKLKSTLDRDIIEAVPGSGYRLKT